MSLNYSANSEKKQAWQKINCHSVKCEEMEAASLVMDEPSVISMWDADVSNSLMVKGVDYATPDIGQPGYSLHTDGAGATYWAVDAIGPDGIQYTGALTAQGKVAVFASNDGLTATQSKITTGAGGTTITSPDDLNSTSITNAQFLVSHPTARIKVDALENLFISPNGTELKVADDTFNVQVGLDRLTISALSTINSSPSGISYHELSDPHWKYIRMGVERVSADSVESAFYSPDGVAKAAIANTAYTVSLAAQTRVNVQSAGLVLSDEAGSSILDGIAGAVKLYDGAGTPFIEATPALGVLNGAVEMTGATQIKGALTLGDVNSYTFPTVRGNANDILSTNGAGVLSWGAPSAGTSISWGTSSVAIISAGGNISATRGGGQRLFISDLVSSIGAPNLIDGISIADGMITQSTTTFTGATLTSTLDTAAPGVLSIGTATTTGINIGQADVPINSASSVILSDGKHLQLGSTQTNDKKCVSILLTANEAIPEGAVLKVVNVGGNGRVVMMLPGDLDDIGVIGVAASATAAAGESIQVCIGGMFKAYPQSGVTIAPGDYVEKSDVTAGRVIGVGAPSLGSFGVAMSTATGDAGRTTFIYGIFQHNEMI